MNNLNKSFWSNYYKSNEDDINKPSSFSEFVYSNYMEKYNRDNIYLKICDLGSGNCRDTMFFSQKGNLCHGIDINGVIKVNSVNCKLIKEDVLTVLKSHKLQTLYDVIYMRWFLHALPYDISKNIFISSLHNLKPNGLICIEVRSINDEELKKNSTYDEGDKSYKTKHKRWLYSIEMCKTLAEENYCDVLYCEEGYFSPNINTETHNPLLIRFICRKRLLPYYMKSKNYNKYKHILPKMKHSVEDYDKMEIMNKILEEHNIKYVAVAGTTLGLNRHGGIIPWDNDIDIGFIEDEWKKLFNIKDLLVKKGFKYEKFGIENAHCHFGPIDCFKLTLKDKYYEGEAKTYCSVDEYYNVVKQIFGYTYIYAPLCSEKSLRKRYGNYFNEGNVNDNFHFTDKSVKVFNLTHHDLSYQLK